MKTILAILFLATSSIFASPWSAIVTNDLTSNNGKTYGSLAVLGDVKGSLLEVNHGGFGDGLYLEGDNKTSNFLRVINGNANILGDNGNIYVPQGGLLKQELNLNHFIDEYYNIADYLSVQNSSLLPDTQNNVTVSLDPNKELHIYSVSSFELNSFKTVNFENLKSSDFVVFNVTDSNVNWKWNLNVDPSQVLINFSGDIFNVSDRHLKASIITRGDIIANHNIEGFVLAQNLILSNGAMLTYCADGLPDPVVLPEPSSALLFAMAGILKILKRSRL